MGKEGSEGKEALRDKKIGNRHGYVTEIVRPHYGVILFICVYYRLKSFFH